MKEITVTLKLPDEHMEFLNLLTRHAGVARDSMIQLAVIVGLPKAGEMILPRASDSKKGGAG